MTSQWPVDGGGGPYPIPIKLISSFPATLTNSDQGIIFAAGAGTIKFPAAPVDGTGFEVISAAAVTIDGNGKDLIYSGGGAYSTFNIQTGIMYRFVYSSAVNLWVLDKVVSIAWNATYDYLAGDIVHVVESAPPGGVRLYMSKWLGNKNNPVSDTDWWVDLSAGGDRVFETILFDIFAGYGSTDTMVPYFSGVTDNKGLVMSYINNSTNGTVVTIIKSGNYAVQADFGGPNSGHSPFGITLNDTGLTTVFDSYTGSKWTEVLANSVPESSLSNALVNNVVYVGPLVENDLLRIHSKGTTPAYDKYCRFRITRIGDIS